jgi:uncharacterized repeat protein (TIGR02059 family)
LTLSGATYYIDPSGSDSNNGSSGSPWKTLAYACSKATSSGDIIHVNAGTYTETTPSILGVGVSIVGVGNTSIIHSNITTAYTYTILLSSSSQGTNGNQSISYIRMEGGMTAYAAILIDRRKNVSIHHCSFEDFFSRGVTFTGSGFYSDAQPTTYATDNSFHDNIMINCSDYVGSGHSGSSLGELEIGGQQGMLVYNNTITQTDRGVDANGFPIKYFSNGYCKGLKIYNNTITKPPYDGSTWDFAIELWNSRGGIEIYNNNIQGGIDIGGNTSITNDAGGYGFAEKIYNNVIGFSTLQSVEENGINVERGITGGIYIFNNLFKNLNNSLQMFQGNGDRFEDLYVYYNIISTVGISGQSNMGNATDWGTIDNSNITYNNINFLNNTIYAGTSGSPLSGLRFNFRGNATNIKIRNNIIQGFKAYPVYLQATGTISNVSVENNLYYGNGTNSASYATTTTNKTEQNNLISNPLFVSSSDFHLQTGSPAIGKGLAINGITTADCAGIALKNPPSIGAYESGSAGLAPVYQSSVTQNATPSLLEMTYNQTLANIVPATTSFSVLVNAVARTVNTVIISGTKVQLTMASALKFGDIVTVSYTKPATNPLQTSTGGVAANISAQTIINNLTNPTKDGTGLTITMTISPNHIHNILNVLLSYSSAPTTAISPEVIKISDSSGILFIEKLLVTGVTNVRIPLNLKSGIYTVLMLANDLEMASQKMIVY